MDFHEAANIFPLDEEHLHELADDIREHGQYQPIEVFEGQILDGRRRWKACKMANVIPKTVEVDPDDPVAYVLSLNLHRRHLTVSQAAMCAQRARKMYDDAAKERQKARKGNQPGATVDNCAQLEADTGKARDQVGQAFGVSGGTVDRARVVIEKAIPEVAKAVDAGKITVYKGKQIATSPKNLQKELLDVAIQGKGKSPETNPREETEPDANPKRNGKPPVGVILANEALNVLMRIPKHDTLRKRGFQIVTDWIRANS